MNRDAVVLACDAGHLPLARFVASRIDALEPGRRFDICICLPDGDVPQDPVPGVAFVPLDTSAVPDLRMQRNWITTGTYYRALLPAIFAGRYRRILYLDTDVFPRRAGIQALFDSASGDFAIAAVEEPMVRRSQRRRKAAKLAALAPSGRYFNAGVLLIGPDAFLGIDGPRRFWDTLRDNAARIETFSEQDQGVLNLAFGAEMLRLSPLYNWHTDPLMTAPMVHRFDPVLLHFVGSRKPWTRHEQEFVASFLPEYQTFLDREFPGFPIIAAASSLAGMRAKPKYRLQWLNQLRLLAARMRLSARRRAAQRLDRDVVRRTQAQIDAAEIGR